MTEDEYISRLENNRFKDYILPIFKILEKRIDEDIDYKDSVILDAILDELNSEDISQNLSAIKKESKEFESDILKTYVTSLQSNIASFKKMPADDTRRSGKVKKLLCSYINVSRFILTCEDLENLMRNGATHGEKIILAIGLVDINSDTIRVNEEINYLVDSSIGKESMAQYKYMLIAYAKM